jgi:hypothetical protein
MRLPKSIGGMLMACPSCGHKFHSDFKLGHAKRRDHRSLFIQIFEMPDKLLARLGRFLRKRFRF